MRLWRNLFRRRHVERELDEETRSYIELLVAEKIKAGASPEAARREAAMEFGGLDQVKEGVRDVRSGALLESFWRDVTYGLRVLRKSPGFALSAIAVLALGIGANTTIFSLVYGVLYRPLPYPDADRVAMVYMHFSPQNAERGPLSPADYFDWKPRNRAFEEIAVVGGRRCDLTGDNTTDQVVCAMATAAFFSILRSAPVMGRAFQPGDDAPGAPPIAMLNERLWRRRYGGQGTVLGRVIVVDGTPCTIVGVMPDFFRFPQTDTELWSNYRFPTPTRRGPFFMHGIGRLRPGVTFEQAQAEMNSIGHEIEQANSHTYSRLTMPVVPLREAMVGRSSAMLLSLLAAVIFVLLIGALNVASLLLARAGSREREMAIRLSLGASRGRLLCQLLTESVLLSLAGGAAGVMLASWGLSPLQAWVVGNLPRLQDVHLDWRVLAFAAVVSIGAGLLTGLAPALEASRMNLSAPLKEGGRSGTPSASRRRTLAALVVVETALSFVLLTGAGLLIRSFVFLQRVDTGVGTAPEKILSMRVSPNPSLRGDGQPIHAYYTRLLERIREMPGVQYAAVATGLPPDANGNQDTFVIEGRAWGGDRTNPAVQVLSVTPDYFRLLGVPLRQGRLFTEADRAGPPLVTIISESMARRFFPGENPLGKRLKESGPDIKSPYMEIVGVVADVKYGGLSGTLPEAYYYPFEQDGGPGRRQNLVVGTMQPAVRLSETLRRAVLEVDGAAVVTQVRTMDEALFNSVSQPRFRTTLVGAFAGVALLLAAVGIYGVVAYSVAQRTQEFGVRIALGAQSGDVLGMVLRDGALLAGAGIGLGIAGSLALTRLFVSLLFSVQPNDPPTFLAVAAMLALVSLAAGLFPALRATRIDPLAALRCE